MRDEQFEKRKAWLATLQAGDEVAVTRNSWAGAAFVIFKIERLTATQFVLEGSPLRYRRDGGSAVGDSHGRIVQVTVEVRENIEQAKLVSWLNGLTNNHRVNANLQQLRAMKTAYDEVSK